MNVGNDSIYSRALHLVLALAALLALDSGVAAAQGTTTRVSVNNAGGQANSASGQSVISGDGRFVAFASAASNLVALDTNAKADVFVHDRENGAMTRVSVNSAGAQANDHSGFPTISVNGRFVAFLSLATNLVAGDTNARWHVFVHDRESGATTRVSVNSAAAQANDDSAYPTISADGRFVAFLSNATNLVAGDTNGQGDVFVHDRDSGETTRVSVSSGGTQANGGAFHSSISANGRFVVFSSLASNLVEGDTNGRADMFSYDRLTNQTTRVSIGSAGAQANGDSSGASISADGRFVAFCSTASNLATGDTNVAWDVFVHDRENQQTTWISVGSMGIQASGDGFPPAISYDGRFVAFYSKAADHVVGDTNGIGDVFVHDRENGEITRVSVSSGGTQGTLESSSASINANGRFVAFTSSAWNLVPGDTNGAPDVFVHDQPWLADMTPPVLTLPTTITADATSPAGAVVSYTASAADNVDPTPTATCAPASGSLFPIGTMTVNCTATDASGNSATGSFSVIIKSAAVQIEDVVTRVKALNAKQGVVDSLDAKLQNVLAALESAKAGQIVSACTKLTAFINEVQAQVGKSITQADADRLIADAERIRAVIGCT